VRPWCAKTPSRPRAWGLETQDQAVRGACGREDEARGPICPAPPVQYRSVSSAPPVTATVRPSGRLAVATAVTGPKAASMGPWGALGRTSLGMAVLAAQSTCHLERQGFLHDDARSLAGHLVIVTTCDLRVNRTSLRRFHGYVFAREQDACRKHAHKEACGHQGTAGDGGNRYRGPTTHMPIVPAPDAGEAAPANGLRTCAAWPRGAARLTKLQPGTRATACSFTRAFTYVPRSAPISRTASWRPKVAAGRVGQRAGSVFGRVTRLARWADVLKPRRSGPSVAVLTGPTPPGGAVHSGC
jgi:hypothetical protein